MSVQISNVFIEQFESEVHMAYQRMGSKLGGLVRKKQVKGDRTNFFKAGKGTAGTKTRHGLVPLMSIDHNSVECTLADYYAADYVDKLDELKINIDERRVVAQSGASALGRKTDELIVTAASAATTNALIATGAVGLNQTKINTTFERFGRNDVPDDGQRYFLIPPEGWTDLLGITAFSSADFVGPNEMPYKGGMVAKQWMSFTWIAFTGLADGAGGATDTRCLAFHRSAIGFAMGQEVNTAVDWIAERHAHLITSSMSQGACNIDELGIQAVDILE
jgi:hypothetical protein